MPIGLKGNSDGSGAIQIGGSDAISISTGLNTTFAGTVTATGTVAGTTGTLYPIVSGTAVTASGTAIDFTSIPSWVKRITVMFNGVSTSGTSLVQAQIGAGSVTTSGYVFYVAYTGGTNQTVGTNSTSGLVLDASLTGNASSLRQGSLTFFNITGNTWAYSWNGAIFNGSAYFSLVGSGSIALSGTLDRVRITTVNGTDTFDAGTINILYE